MKRAIKFFVLILISFFTLAFVSSNKVSANMAPNIGVHINIIGDINGKYMTLLYKDKEKGRYSADSAPKDEIDKKFKSYVDKDNYYYLGNKREIKYNYYSESYYPPETFKVLIYDPVDDKFITDDNIYKCYAYYSEFELTLTGDGFTFERSKSIALELINFLLRVTLSIAIEIGIALYFRFRKQQLSLIVLVNLITQLILNILLNLVIYFNGFYILFIIPYYIISEILVVLIETALYYVYMPKVEVKYSLPKKTHKEISWYTILANIASLVLGVIILSLVPGMH